MSIWSFGFDDARLVEEAKIGVGLKLCFSKCSGKMVFEHNFGFCKRLFNVRQFDFYFQCFYS